MVSPTKFGLSIEVGLPYEETIVAVKAALKEEGFGVLTEIDIQATLREKLDVPFRRYDIIGACNPSLALEALGADLEVGLLLPCNVIVYEEEGKTRVTALDPALIARLSEQPALERTAEEARKRLTRALEAVAGA